MFSEERTCYHASTPGEERTCYHASTPDEGMTVSTTAQKRQRSPHQPVGRWIRVEKRLAIYMRDRFSCSYCGRDLRHAEAAEIALDHLVPRSAGGSNDATNLVTACRACNSQRGDKPWMDYATGGAIERIETNRHQALNIGLAKAIVEGRGGNAEEENRR